MAPGGMDVGATVVTADVRVGELVLKAVGTTATVGLGVTGIASIGIKETSSMKTAPMRLPGMGGNAGSGTGLNVYDQ
eukprot:CAMPEP_0201660840 /NCGR_PEP_ID=MMETSP0494-20130426/3372_1 /ASSEMBLY_ACC=CAM_ASM_000839 /TAXON_ID=420259 /ORGANISM="Thalassiosira gravida, Strain GMp14c1" /LENGTH=76 /DNA_ID=CAMNT_0048138803 /DNA_START=33 /DNA_END=260 /DNA_ORIENTATION=+